MDNRYYFTGFENNKAIFYGQEAQHMIKVRRCKEGDTIVAFNNTGFDFNLKINKINKNSVETTFVSKSLNKSFNDPKITVYLSMIKNEALCEAIDHLAELNVKSVKLFKSDYSVAQIEENKLEKLKSIAIQASKQSERADIMEIEIIKEKDIEQDVKSVKNVFFAYENSATPIKTFNGEFALIIGPEGGFSEKENQYFSAFAKNVSLGNTILRAEVACVAGVSILKGVQHES